MQAALDKPIIHKSDTVSSNFRQYMMKYVDK